MTQYSHDRTSQVDSLRIQAKNRGVLHVATVNVEYPQPLAYCADSIIRWSCL